MIDSRLKLKEFLNCESKNYNVGSKLKYILLLLMGRESAVIWNLQKRLRVTEYHYNMHHKIRYYFSKCLLNHKSHRYGLHIGLNIVDKGLWIMHLGPILTNSNVRVGENCAIHINTALVAQGVNNGTPTIGNDVVIGLGATILGEITIADGIAIGANALVNKSFTEKGIAIAGNPAKKVSDNGRKQWEKNRD